MSAIIYGKVYNKNTGLVITTATVSCPGQTVNNNQGNYTCTVSTGGTYAFTAAASGFTPQTQNITVSNGQNKKVDFQLTPA
jgi:hypothetical protein